MKHLIIIVLASALLGCQKSDLVSPSETSMAKGQHPVYVLSEILMGYKEYPPNTRIHKNMFSEGRLLYKGGMDDGFFYAYDDARNVITLTLDYPTETLKQTIEYVYNPNRQLVSYKDSTTRYEPFVGGMLNNTGTYQYHGTMLTGEVAVHYGSGPYYGVSTVKIDIISPSLTKNTSLYRYYKNTEVIYEQLTISFIKQTGPYETTVYNEHMQVMEIIQVSPTIKDPEYNIPGLPSFERITDKVARDKSRGGVPLAGPSKLEGLWVISHTYYDGNGNMTYSRIKEDIVTNSENLPVYYREGNGTYKLIYTKL